MYQFPTCFCTAIFLIVSGPVRDLKCSYNTLKDQELSCEWHQPEPTFAPIQSYLVKVIHKGTVLHQMSTSALMAQMKGKLINEEIYTVSVTVVTNTERAVAETRVVFISKGKQYFWTFS